MPLAFLKQLLNPLKPVLVPVWNSAHQAGWWLAEHGDALAHGRREFCNNCGCRSWMLLQKRAIPPRLIELWGLSPVQASALARKETLSCTRCGARLRSRRIAAELLKQFPAETASGPARSIAEWVQLPRAQALAVAEFNQIDGLHQPLLALPDLHYSEFFEGVQPGQPVQGIRCEDLTQLTYPAERFDLVLTSETLEHVQDLHQALREIHRVLRPGGLHIFTIPRLPGTVSTYARARLDLNGKIETVVRPLLHHPGGDVGYPVFTEFGADVREILQEAGFQAHEHFGPLTDSDFAQVWVTQKT